MALDGVLDGVDDALARGEAARVGVLLVLVRALDGGALGSLIAWGGRAVRLGELAGEGDGAPDRAGGAVEGSAYGDGRVGAGLRSGAGAVGWPSGAAGSTVAWR